MPKRLLGAALEAVFAIVLHVESECVLPFRRIRDHQHSCQQKVAMARCCQELRHKIVLNSCLCRSRPQVVSLPNGLHADIILSTADQTQALTSVRLMYFEASSRAVLVPCLHVKCGIYFRCSNILPNYSLISFPFHVVQTSAFLSPCHYHFQLTFWKKDLV